MIIGLVVGIVGGLLILVLIAVIMKKVKSRRRRYTLHQTNTVSILPDYLGYFTDLSGVFPQPEPENDSITDAPPSPPNYVRLAEIFNGADKLL